MTKRAVVVHFVGVHAVTVTSSSERREQKGVVLREYELLEQPLDYEHVGTCHFQFT